MATLTKDAAHERQRLIDRAESDVRGAKREVWFAERRLIELRDNITLCKCNSARGHHNYKCGCARPILPDDQPGCMERARDGDLCHECQSYVGLES